MKFFILVCTLAICSAINPDYFNNVNLLTGIWWRDFINVILYAFLIYWFCTPIEIKITKKGKE